MTLFDDTYTNRNVLVTGHSGFKGSWLSLWLTELGANVCGVSLPDDANDGHWNGLQLDVNNQRQDLRDYESLSRIINEQKPEIVFHLAAQALVRRSYTNPLETWSSNVMGTANLLEACRHCDSVKAIIVITSDKCYENNEWQWGYRENDRLGGHDPYSASKAAAELVTQSFRNSFFDGNHQILLASARAGNVIGGGDWSEDRLIPDAARAVQANLQMTVRSPYAVRPWQHVLESLSGYLLLGQRLIEGKNSFANAWNFGPYEQSNRTVEEMLNRLQTNWPELQWNITEKPQPHEAGLLKLDSSKSHSLLNWRPVWTWEQCIDQTASWYHTYLQHGTLMTRQQLAEYIDDAKNANVEWTSS